MPVLSTSEDIKSLTERFAGIKIVSSAIVHGIREYHSNCPWCGGTDRFITRPETGTYSCAIRSSGCGRHGDMLDFLKDYAGIENMREACEEIGLDPDDVDFVLDERAEERALARTLPPSKAWQDTGRAYIHLFRTRQTLHFYSHALEHLHKRGLTDETIQKFDLQYIPLVKGSWIETDAEEWGLSPDDFEKGKLKLPEGILIPWQAEGNLWKLEVRRLIDVKPNAKYGFVRGGQDNIMYNLDAIQPGKPVVLVESALCAVSGTQECGDLAVFIATGGASKAHEERFLKLFRQASFVLVAFDDDELDAQGKRAGDEGATYWTDNLSHAMRWTPWGHDVNDMLRDGKDIRKWLLKGMKFYEQLQRAKSIPVFVQMPEPERKASEEKPPVVQKVEQLPNISRSSAPPVAVYVPSKDIPTHCCPAESSVEDAKGYVKLGKLCGGKQLADGWCADHHFQRRMLDLGATINYPRIQVNAYLTVGEGKANWEAYAVRMPSKRAAQLLAKVQILVSTVHI